jgi:predicted transcriptional regulator
MAARLGPLEQRVMQALWRRDDAARVRDLQPEFDDIAYTTLMTTLDRLHRKGLLERGLVGRAFAYRARVTREQLHASTVLAALRGLVSGGAEIAPVLSFLLDEAIIGDERELDALERLIKARRRALQERER